MFVPYVTAVPQIFPVYPTGNLPLGPAGLSHAGIQPLYGNTLGYINPLQMQQYGYGYRPVSPYGYGLSHAGYGYEGGYANPMGYGYAPYGHGYGYGYAPIAPISPISMYGAPGISPMGMQSPLQPNWSPIAGQPTQQG